MTHDLERETPPPPDLKTRVTRSLRARGILRGRPARWPLVAAVAAALVVFGAGVLLGRRAAAPPQALDEPAYLLVLHEDARFQPDRPEADLVQEYGAWAGALAEQGKLVVAEQLDGWSTVLPSVAGSGQAPPSAGELGAMTGFFLIRAADREGAVEVAGTHPHLRYGGRIVVLGTAGS